MGKQTQYTRTQTIQKSYTSIPTTHSDKEKGFRLENKYRNIIPVRTNFRQNESPLERKRVSP